MHMTLNWCFTRVLIDAIGFNRCFIISSFNLATLQQFFKKRQNRRYYHFKTCYTNTNDGTRISWFQGLNSLISIIKNEGCFSTTFSILIILLQVFLHYPKISLGKLIIKNQILYNILRVSISLYFTWTKVVRSETVSYISVQLSIIQFKFRYDWPVKETTYAFYTDLHQILDCSCSNRTR